MGAPQAVVRLSAVVACAGALGVTSPALAADPSGVCFDAYVEAQRLRKDGKLKDARERLRACSAAECPALIRKDCTTWSEEIERSLPTVVFIVRDGANDVVDVDIFVDERRIAQRADGLPVAIDPGPHAVRFQVGERRVEQRVVVATGDANRRVQCDLSPAPSAVSTGVPTASVVLGGVAALGLASFVTFAVSGKATQSCEPDCTGSQVSALRRDYLVADVSWITGLLALGGAAYLWLAQPRVVAPAVQGSALRLTLEF